MTQLDEQVRIEDAIYAHAADHGEFAIAYALIQVAAALNEGLPDIAAAIEELKKGSSE